MTVKYSSKIGHQYTPDELRQFRHDLSTLKKQGLIGGKVDVRTATPNQIRGGKPLREYIVKYDDVLSGKATAIPLSKLENQKQQKKLFETVTSGRIEPHVIVPHVEGEKVSISGGVVKIAHPKGINRLEIPIDYTNLPQYLKDLKAAEKSGILPELKGPHYYAFNLKGGQSHAIFRNIDELVKYLNTPRYKWIKQAKRGTPAEQRELFRNLEIVSTTQPAWWNTKEKRDARREEAKRKRRNKKRAAKRKQKRGERKK